MRPLFEVGVRSAWSRPHVEVRQDGQMLVTVTGEVVALMAALVLQGGGSFLLCNYGTTRTERRSL